MQMVTTPFASFRCDAKVSRYRSRADSRESSALQLYGFTVVY